MVKIWAKVILENRIINQCIFSLDGEIDYSEFHDYLKEICGKLDIATPVLIKAHLFSYAKYNTVKFTKDDFLEKIDFDKLVLENIGL